jgi:hypothetical protein
MSFNTRERRSRYGTSYFFERVNREIFIIFCFNRRSFIGTGVLKGKDCFFIGSALFRI